MVCNKVHYYTVTALPALKLSLETRDIFIFFFFLVKVAPGSQNFTQSRSNLEGPGVNFCEMMGISYTVFFYDIFQVQLNYRELIQVTDTFLQQTFESDYLFLHRLRVQLMVL